MSKLLISCDNSLFYNNGTYYFKDKEWYDFYMRYLRVFDHIRIANRVIEEDIIPPKRIKVEDYRVEVIHIPDFSGPIEYAKRYFRIGRCLTNIVQGCDVAIVRLPSIIGQRVCTEVIKAGLPYAVEVVYDAEDGWRSESNFIYKLLWMKIDRDMRLSCKKANGVSCVTEKYLQRHYFSIKPDHFVSNYSSLALDKSFYSCPKQHPSDRSFVIANVANQVQFNGRKGFNEIIESLSILKQRGVIVNAKFVGQSYHNGIEKLKDLSKLLGVYNQIEYMGYLTRTELDYFLSSVDLFVMPTRAEGLPRVIIEAMAKGLPCITTPVSGNPELVSGHFLVKYSDVNTLADRIEELVMNKSLYELTSKENFEHSLQYEASVLENRRDMFYYKLKGCINVVHENDN